MKKITLCLLLMLVLFASGKNVWGQAKSSPAKPILSLSPAIINVTLSPGRTYQRVITVTNRLKSPLPFRVAFDALEPGTPSILKWITIERKDYIIPAGASERINLTVTVPRKIPLGGYYGTVLIEPVLPGAAGSRSSVQARAAVIILANIGVKEKVSKAQISDLKIPQVQFAKDPLEMSFDVKNLSLYHFLAKPIVKISSLNNSSSQVLEEKLILPGRSRPWLNRSVSSNINAGVYNIELAISVGDGEQIKKSQYLIVLPGLKETILLLTGAICILLLFKRKNVKKAVSILFSKKS